MPLEEGRIMHTIFDDVENQIQAKTASTAELSTDGAKVIVKSWKHCLWTVFRFKLEMSQTEFEYLAQYLYTCCLVNIKDLHELHLKRQIGIKLLNEIVERANLNYIGLSHLTHIFWSSLSCIHHFQLRLKATSVGIIQWYRKREFKESMNTYKRLLNFVKNDSNRVILHAIIIFNAQASLWDIESLSCDLLSEVMNLTIDAEVAIEDILSICEQCLIRKPNEARQVLLILAKILEKIQWKCLSERFMNRFLDMFESSICPEPLDKYNYSPLKSGLEICLKNIIDNLNNEHLMTLIEFILKWIIDKNLDQDVLLDFGNLAEYAAFLYTSTSFLDCLPKQICSHIFELMSSSSHLHSLLGNRILQNLIDRCNNRQHFDTPRIFFQDAQYDIVLNICKTIDKNYFRENRNRFHDNLFYSISNHVNNRIILESIYTTLAILLVELPCGYTAAAGVCFAMAVQEYTLNNDAEFNIEHRHHLHAFVMAIMTLICYVHNAEVFYEYVNAIMLSRAEWAPHLNPPIKSHYEYAEHHILWHKPELFFEDWEARYGLWQCFQRKNQCSQKSKKFLIAVQ